MGLETSSRSPDPSVSRGKRSIGTFQEAEALFQNPPLDSTRTVFRRTGSMISLVPGRPRVHRVTAFELGQLPYVNELNFLLYEKFNTSFSEQIIAAYQKDPIDNASRFDRAFFSGVKGCITEVAQEHPELLPVLKSELVDNGAGGFEVAQAIVSFYIEKTNKGEELNPHPVFPKTHAGYRPDVSSFIAHQTFEEHPDEARKCLGNGIALELFTQALHAHKILSQEAESPILMEREDITVGEELPTFVQNLYQKQKEKERTNNAR